MWFAAKEAVERKAMAKGRQMERERLKQTLVQELAQLGISMPEESITRILTGQPAALPQTPPPLPYRRRPRRSHCHCNCQCNYG